MIYKVFSQGTDSDPRRFPVRDEPWIYRGQVAVACYEDAVPVLLHRDVASDSDRGIWYEVLTGERTPNYWKDGEGIHGKPVKESRYD